MSLDTLLGVFFRLRILASSINLKHVDCS